MLRVIASTLLVLVTLENPIPTWAQARGTTTPATPTPQTPAPGAPAPGTPAPAPAQPQRGQRAAAPKPPMPLTLRQVLEALSSTRNSARVEDQISKAGVQFQATPGVLDVLKEFGASAKLLSMIPAPPTPPAPPAPKMAGALTVVCEPKDCAVIVDETYKGPTTQNRLTVTGLPAGNAKLEIYAEGYEPISRQIQLPEGKPAEEKFALKRSTLILQQSASASLLKALSGIGGIDGVQELADLEGNGFLQWTNSGGQVEEWMMTFNKRIGKDLVVTFKSKDGQCTASISGQNAKQDCRGGLKNSGEKIAQQATLLLLSYQVHDVMQTLLKRPLITSETDENRLESSDTKDSYVLTLDSDGLPVDLVYRIGDNDTPVQVRYANYMSVNKARYPGRIAIGRLNSQPVWVFAMNSVRTKVTAAR